MSGPVEPGRPSGDGAPVVVDARGLRCPLPVVRLAAAARDRPPGERLVVWSTDPAARHDVPAWARMRGHRVVGEETLPAEGGDGNGGDGNGGDQDETRTTWSITVELGPFS
ncbi:sulfurtransferase TusA family protein [Cellulosimicrobium sp. NPDC057127]|uniref:sulfurtransferase TusA family protein n=1 Tax=Cellulosimicrobium sp. NPDC057127 TaxID=3346026 RepID=UPI003642012C